MTQTNKFFERQYTCPVCKTTFTSLAVRSSAVYVEKKDTDLHTIYAGISPLHYQIIVCPTCQYAASSKKFSKELPKRTTQQLALALSRLKPRESQCFNQERNAAIALECFQLAIRSAQLKKVPDDELAGLLLAAAWMAREIDNNELEDVYLQESLAHYLEAFNKGFGSVGNMSDLLATYLIGELYRRTGSYPEAVNWFNKAIFHPDIKSNPNIEKLARDQWSLTREQVKSGNYTAPVAADTSASSTDSPAKTPETPEAQESRPSFHPRRTLQISLNLYTDQIDWLNQVVNHGYNFSKKLVTKEQVVRALVDAAMEVLEAQTPETFSSEEELKQAFLNTISSSN